MPSSDSPPIGFSSGALTKGDIAAGFACVQDLRLPAIEISALRSHELDPVLDFCRRQRQPLSEFTYCSFHAPSSFEASEEPAIVCKLHWVAEQGWPIVVHPDTIHDPVCWRELGSALVLENMDIRKPAGRTVEELEPWFDQLPDAGLCLDFAHAHQIDPSMHLAFRLLKSFAERLRQFHVSSLDETSRHIPINFETLLAMRRLLPSIPPEIPVIIESVTAPENADSEVKAAHLAFNRSALAVGSLWEAFAEIIPRSVISHAV